MKPATLIKLLFISLILQFILGMLSNLYAKIPSQPYEVFHQLGFITLHAINGTILLVLSVMLFITVRKTSHKTHALRGMIDIIGAFIAGELYLFTKVELFSFVMAIGFLGALISYTRLMFNDEKLQS